MKSVLLEDYSTLTVDALTNLDDRTYIYEMAQMLKLGLIRDSSFYEWSILNFQDIMEKDKQAISYIIDKVKFIMMYFESKDPRKVKEYKLLSFGEVFANALGVVLDEKYNESSKSALGMIASAYVSYKREMLSMEEFYEIRDMFVPFDMPISLDKYDVNKAVDKFKEIYGAEDDFDNFVLLKKTGKAVFANNIKISEVEDAFKNLIVEWD